MRRQVLAGLLGLATLLGGGVSLPQARAAVYQGYYTAKAQGHGYAYRKCYYYSKAKGGYRYHVAVYHPARPRYVYYYNPSKGKYWGRYDLAAGGYSLLAEGDQRATPGEISESAFPRPGRMPPPEAGDEEPMLPPPESFVGNMPRAPSSCNRR
jgi:hypothetical protein